MAMREMRWRNRLFVPVFLLVLTTIYVAAAFRISPQFSEGLVGPRFLPLVSALLMYGALLHIIRNELVSGEESEKGGFWRPAAIVVATAAYIALFKPLGYSVSTLAYVCVLFHIFRYHEGRPLRRLIYAIAVTAVFYGLFALVFGVRLPTLLDLI
ncbi:tripartite tricarboxylate transporter TctB family protein [Chelativorans sp. M5D2P16]|uniref:tripartite tricarboxylate transporter TctB family protein n=1 Tax=Chelativorans sp. M5D2P16 TaxID=3095678 RepID=UPI002ACAA068|nr:tripartite tricarboxylate transporter TctB family protein [Chelativorans sp. M5D2P16]MDZ5696544.1 tripartite tricarboxylate transporter TctB family protein [Chelativorans sp. M5D2P16]